MNQHPIELDTAPATTTAGETRNEAPAALSEAALAGLVARIRGGDREALGQLYRETRPAVTRYLVRRMDVCPADVEDVVQETFIRAPEMAEDFKPATTEVGAWLCGRVAHWTLTDFYRKQRYRQHSAVDAAIDTARRAVFESAHERESRPLSSRVVAALARLTPAQRRAVQLRYLDGHSNQTAAELAGSTPKALATSCLQGRKRLAAGLADLAPRPVSWVATIPKVMAVRVALAELGQHDVPAALAWLRQRGVQVDESYVYQIRKSARAPRQNTKETAVRAVLAQVGACDAATVQARLRQRGVEASKSYINRVRNDAGAPLPAAKNTVVRAALAELGTSDAATVQAHLRERGIEASKSYINQVRRTSTPAAPAAAAESANAVDARVDTSASNHQAVTAAEAGGTQGGGLEAAATATAAVARARAAVARIPAARARAAADSEPARWDCWHDHAAQHPQDGLTASGGRDQLEVSA